MQAMLPLSTTVSEEVYKTEPFRTQLLKWIGNKQRFASEIISNFPAKFNNYFEPFLGSGAVLGTLAPKKGVGSDSYKPLIDIWKMLKDDSEILKKWYQERWETAQNGNKKEAYEKIKTNFNSNPNGADLLFLSRSCYGGVIRFRQSDGYMSTPCGIHEPISPNSFNKRVDIWKMRLSGSEFFHKEYEESMIQAKKGDLVYCDPPYSFSQSILYGAHSFDLKDLFEVIERCKRRGVYVALSIDGTKKSGDLICNIPVPKGLFEREILVNCGRSMLKRFQMNGRKLEKEDVSDRLLLTY